MEKVDQVINAICDWIQKQIDYSDIDEMSRVPDMTKALAELVTARAMPQNVVNNYNISSDK